MRILLKEDRVYIISKPILQWWSEQIKQPITILSQQGSFWHGFGGTYQYIARKILGPINFGEFKRISDFNTKGLSN